MNIFNDIDIDKINQTTYLVSRQAEKNPQNTKMQIHDVKQYLKFITVGLCKSPTSH